MSYMDRALRARDPRFARVLGKLGYDRRDLVVLRDPLYLAGNGGSTQPEQPDDVAALRAEYERLLGKKPFNGWGADKLREKIAAAMAEG